MAAAIQSNRNSLDAILDLAMAGEANELRYFFRSHESTIGMKSNHSALVACLEGVAIGSGPPAHWDPYAAVVHEITRAKRAWRKLKVMDDGGQRAHLIVLHRLYGERIPDKHEVFGDLGTLASLTEAVATTRDELSCKLGEERETLTRLRCLNVVDDAATAFWRVAPRWEAAEMALQTARRRAADARTEEEQASAAEVLAMARSERRTARLATRVCLEARPVDSLGATLSVLSGTDREVTHEDAIRWKLEKPAYDGPRKPDGSPKVEAHARWESEWERERAHWISTVRVECREMRQRAHNAYRAARPVFESRQGCWSRKAEAEPLEHESSYPVVRPSDRRGGYERATGNDHVSLPRDASGLPPWMALGCVGEHLI